MRGSTLRITNIGGSWSDEEGNHIQTIDELAAKIVEGNKNYPLGVKIGTVLIVKIGRKVLVRR